MFRSNAIVPPVEALIELENQKQKKRVIDNVVVEMFGRTVEVGIEKQPNFIAASLGPFYNPTPMYKVYWHEDYYADDLQSERDVIVENPYPLYKDYLKELVEELKDDIKTHGEEEKPWWRCMAFYLWK
jgi:hypothetical protein